MSKIIQLQDNGENVYPQIYAGDLFTVKSVEMKASIGAGADYNLSATVPTVSGYSPIGIVGRNNNGFSYYSWLTTPICYLSGSKVYVAGRNSGSGSTGSTATITIYILYKRNS